MLTSKLDIWEKVEQTDPKNTKRFKRAGGFSGTALNPTYCKFRLTELFGPAGKGWGYTVLEEEIMQGHFLDDNNRMQIHKVKIAFWYKMDGEKFTIEAYGQTTFVGKNSNGLFTDEEAPKKSLTDAWMKAASDLGLSADVHLGLYDDSKYVAELQQQFKEKETPAGETGASKEGGNIKNTITHPDPLTEKMPFDPTADDIPMDPPDDDSSLSTDQVSMFKKMAIKHKVGSKDQKEILAAYGFESIEQATVGAFGNMLNELKGANQTCATPN